MNFRPIDENCRWTSLGLSVLIIIGGCSGSGQGSEMLAAARRHIRGLSYPAESEMGLFFALAVPLDDPVSTKSISVAFFFEANYKLPNNLSEFQSENSAERSARSIDRKSIYAILESKFEASGLPGKQCLLRSICETARAGSRLHAGHNGLVGDLMRITLTPSSSEDEALPAEYAEAELTHPGQSDCAVIHHLCPISIYELIASDADDLH